MNSSIRVGLAAIFLLLVASVGWSHSPAFLDYFEFDDSNDGETMTAAVRAALREKKRPALTACVGGVAAGFPCDKIDLQAFMPRAQLGATGGTQLNDIWGWTDPVTGAEIAIVGLTNGTSFVDVSDPENPIYLGVLPSHNGGVDTWRDIKVYNDHAFIVADGGGNSSHGLQVFDLTQLDGINSPPQTLSETAHFNGFGRAHNIAINEDTGYAYVVGSNQCSGGLYMVDISTPTSPGFAGCFSADGYTHDAQCVIYNGPDTDHQGKEVCVAYNEDTITIVDVSDKDNPAQISRTPYAGARYTHQGWFVDDTHTALAMNDELDETQLNVTTRTYFYDVTNLDSPVQQLRYDALTPAIDHNLYSRNGYIFQSNYRAGLRILSTEELNIGGPGTPEITEVAFFDVIPNSDSAQFSGTWSNYVDFASGNIILSDIGGGLFVLRPDWPAIIGIEDTTPPVLIAPVDTTVAAVGPAGAPISNFMVQQFLQGASATDDFDGAVPVTNDAPSMLPLGSTNITFTAQDTAGNSALATAQLTVTDQSFPLIAVPPDLTVVSADGAGVDAGAAAIQAFLSGATANDNVDGMVPVSNNAPMTFAVGTTEVEFTAMDAAGNVGRARGDVTVELNAAPTVDDPGALLVLELAPVDTLVIQMTATDSNVGDPLGDWEIISGNDSRDGDAELPFALDPNTGALRVNDSGDLALGLGAEFSLQVVVRDSLTASAPRAVQVRIGALTLFTDGFEVAQ